MTNLEISEKLYVHLTYLFFSQEYLYQLNLMSPEDIFENFGESHHCKKLKFENFGESQLKMVSAGLM